MGAYLRPDTLDEALKALAAEEYDILAGGTDYYPARVGLPLDGDVLDITAIAALRGISRTGDGDTASWRIGATTSWTDVIRADLPAAFDGLRLAAHEVGGVQIQNAGTVAGNLCNASPAADGVPPLLALDASVELASASGIRQVPLGKFIQGNRQTDRRPDELVTAVLVPALPAGAVSSFWKLGARKYLVISIVMASAVLVLENDTVADARIAVGACSAVARRLPDLERALAGVAVGDMDGVVTAARVADVLSPIDDVRASAGYRSDAAVTVVRRALGMAAGRPADLEVAA